MYRTTIGVALVLSLFLGTPSTALAQKGGGSHASGGSKSSGSSGGSSKPVHVKAYTKKDGTYVEAHDRKAPEPKGSPASASGSSTTTSTPIRLYTDPVTGVKTFTNEPAPVLPSRTVAPLAALATRSAVRSMFTIPPTTASMIRTTSPRRSATEHAARSANGRIARSAAAKHAFEVQTGYPHGRPGYVVDHIKALACGGADAPSNMQWQTVAAAKAKDKTERVACH